MHRSQETSSIFALTGMQSEALRLQRNGHTRASLDMLNRSMPKDDAATLMLRARALVTLSPAGAIAILQDERWPKLPGRFQAEAALLRGRAHTKLGALEAAATCFALAHDYLEQEAVFDHDLFCEIELSTGTMMIAGMRIEEAERIANALYANKRPSPHAGPTLALMAEIAWCRKDSRRSAEYLLQALRSISIDTNPDVQLWAETVKRLAVVIQYSATPATRQAAAAHAAALPWTEELADMHSQVRRLLGMRALLDGEISEGLALLRSAGTTPSASLRCRLKAILDHAEMSRCLDEPFAFEEYLWEATALAQQVDWKTVAWGDREALLQLAEMHARTDPALALSFASQFEALGGFGAANMQRAANAAIAASQQNYCLGVLYIETGQKNRGIALLEAAYAGFVNLRINWVAGITAIVLAEATNSMIWRSCARECLAEYPNSYLSKRLARLNRVGDSAVRNLQNVSIEHETVRSLTPTQRTVYLRLLENASIPDIAADLDRSTLTVRNHIQAIFRKFGVNTRAELVFAHLEGSAGRRRNLARVD